MARVYRNKQRDELWSCGLATTRTYKCACYLVDFYDTKRCVSFFMTIMPPCPRPALAYGSSERTGFPPEASLCGALPSVRQHHPTGVEASLPLPTGRMSENTFLYSGQYLSLEQ